MRYAIARLLEQRFGDEWKALATARKSLVAADFETMLRDEYDVDDATTHISIASDNAHEASREYRRRIGGGNLSAYSDALAAGLAGASARTLTREGK
jgi:hypothetical protein